MPNGPKIKDPAAVALGSRTSKRKATAARENGKLGGRPVTLCQRCRKPKSAHFRLTNANGVFFQCPNEWSGKSFGPGTFQPTEEKP